MWKELTVFPHPACNLPCKMTQFVPVQIHNPTESYKIQNHMKLYREVWDNNAMIRSTDKLSEDGHTYLHFVYA
jgi:hypothetical protein